MKTLCLGLPVLALFIALILLVIFGGTIGAIVVVSLFALAVTYVFGLMVEDFTKALRK